MTDAATQTSLPELTAERDDLDRYLEDTIVVDWQTPTVYERAQALVQGCDSEQARVRALYEFVRDEIAHSFDIETDVVACSASEVLREGTGLCYAKSHLLAALLRARGIPAGFGYQRLRRDPPARGFVLHGFVVAWLGSLGRWLPLDARGNNERVTTGFSLEAPRLAYEPDREAGEETLPSILARPGRRVVDILDHADSLARIRDHLPDRLV